MMEVTWEKPPLHPKLQHCGERSNYLKEEKEGKKANENVKKMERMNKRKERVHIQRCG
jgi:hypothetical protein